MQTLGRRKVFRDLYVIPRFWDHGLTQKLVPASCLSNSEVVRLAWVGQVEKIVLDKLYFPYLMPSGYQERNELCQSDKTWCWLTAWDRSAQKLKRSWGEISGVQDMSQSTGCTRDSEHCVSHGHCYITHRETPVRHAPHRKQWYMD